MPITSRRLRSLLAVSATAGACLVVAAPAQAEPIVGISDNKPATLTDPLFAELGVKRARLITPWNSIYTEPQILDTWLQAARARGVEPLVSFQHARGDRCPATPCRGPSPATFQRMFRAFRAKYPWVRVVNPWNEANHQTQPTGKNPRLAAQYFNVVKANCVGCTIIAADVLDSSNLKVWLTTFKRYANRPGIWGLHNYTDTNRFRTTGTLTLLRNTRGSVWLTETGGVTSFVTSDGRVALPYSEARSERATRYMFQLALRYQSRIKRIYIYNWKSDAGNRFDAGLIRPNGTPRPAYNVVKSYGRLIR